MTIKVINDQQALQEGLAILIAHLEPAKVARFVAACKLGEGDYLKLKDKLFAKETVASLYEKVKAYQDSSSNSWFSPRQSMAKLNEDVVEQATLEWLETLGYTPLNASEIAPDSLNSERQTYADVVLIDRLRSALATINDKIPPDAIEEAIRKVTRTDTPSLFENNRRFHKLLTDGVDVEYQAEGRTIYDKVWLIDFTNPDNNDWLAVNQFTIIEKKNNRRPDVVIFINVLPLGVIELKNPTDENATIKGAFNKLQTYKNDIPSLFPYNEILIVSDGTEARVGTLTASFEWFMPWRTIDGETIVPTQMADARLFFFRYHAAPVRLSRSIYRFSLAGPRDNKTSR